MITFCVCFNQLANSKASGGTVQNIQLFYNLMQLAALRYIVTFEMSSPPSIFNGNQVARLLAPGCFYGTPS